MSSFLAKMSSGAAPDLLIYLACLVVPVLLLVHARRMAARDRRLFGLFALFAVACGLTHSLMMFADAAPSPAVAGAAKLFAVVVAGGAALVAVRYLPRAFTAVEEAIHEDDLEQYRLLAAAVHASGDGILVAEASSGPGLRIALANPAFERMTGYSTYEAVGLSPSILFGGDSETEARALTTIRAALRGTEPTQFEIPGRRKDGTRLWAEWQVVPVPAREGGRSHWVAVLRDTTERREREEFLRALIAHTPCGVFWKDRNSKYLGCNDQVARNHGVECPDQLIGRTDRDLPGLTPAEAEAYIACDRRVIETGEPMLHIEEPQTRLDGTQATLLTSKVPLRDAAGGVIGVLGVYQDITEHKRLERQLRESAKLEAVGQLARGIAHDFNNLLTVVLGNADLLAQSEIGDEEQLGLVADIRLAADRGAGLIRRLLMLSRRQPTRTEVVDLNDVVTGMGGLLGRWLGGRVEVRTALSRDAVRVRGDRIQFDQVLLNLAVNARDAMPEGGTLTVTTELARDPKAGTPVARLVVSDTGCGMTDEVRAHIFEAFFTTKDVGKGTGLGLATVRGIVEQSGGTIEVESAVGAGTTFRVTLPACPAPLAPPSPRDTDTPPPGGTGHSVLLVEDEDQVRKFARLTLEGRGYVVAEASDGDEALPILAEREFDLLVTDVSMPGMGGEELAKRARARQPDLGIIFISGGAPDAAKLELVPGAAYLPKPFPPHDLLRAVRKVLYRAAAATGVT